MTVTCKHCEAEYTAIPEICTVCGCLEFAKQQQISTAHDADVYQDLTEETEQKWEPEI